MTRQPAVHLGAHLLVAIDAKAHFEILADQTVHFFHLAMTILAVKPRFEMRPVVEFHMVRNVKNPNPGHRRLRFQMPPLLHDLGVLGNDVLVAIETKVHGRDSGVMRPFDIGMTEAAVDLLDAGMHPMAEKNRLNRTDPLTGGKIIEIEKTGEKKNQDPKENESPKGSVSFTIQIFHGGSQSAAPTLTLLL